MRPLALLLALAFTFPHATRAQQNEPWLKAGDVVALVGGEDMVALAEEGWLETLVTWGQPKDHIRFRSLAWEGDTVFEQRRDLNYPTLETQLDRMGATVVICQFGLMESLAGKEGVAAFTEAYGKLIDRLNPEKKRRISLVKPHDFGFPQERTAAVNLSGQRLSVRNLNEYIYAISHVAAQRGARHEDPREPGKPTLSPTRDGVHLSAEEQEWKARTLADGYGSIDLEDVLAHPLSARHLATQQALRAAIVAKNRLWFHYTRPQNWAFLAGNRTNQPSSRDHLDPSKRWFPEEMEQWVPLIEAKEKEIWALAAAPR